MGNFIGIAVLVLFLGAGVWYFFLRKKDGVEPNVPGTGGGDVTPPDTDPVITDDEGNEFTEDELNTEDIDPDKLNPES